MSQLTGAAVPAVDGAVVHHSTTVTSCRRTTVTVTSSSSIFPVGEVHHTRHFVVVAPTGLRGGALTSTVLDDGRRTLGFFC